MARVGSNRVNVAIVTGWAGITPEEWQANLTLIHAAPDMLAALKSIMPFLRDMEDDYKEHGVPELLNNVKTTINKALGTP